MIIDTYFTIVMEQSGYPGNIGDSCAETSRATILGQPGHNLLAFRTDLGYVRHPTAPEKDDKGNNWREPDFSDDQALPLYLAFLYRGQVGLAEEMTRRHKPTHIGLKLAFGGHWRLFALSTIIQGWLLKLQGGSADYLNYAVSIVFLRNKGIQLRANKETMDKVVSYYKPEPNAFVLQYYAQRLVNQ